MSLFNPNSYQKENGIITRIDHKEVSPHCKQILLKECLSFFTDGELPLLNDFIFIGLDDNETNINCICSQKIIHVYIIQHIPSKIKFKIGSNCFEKLYQTNENDFFKPYCLNNCNNKVLSRRTKEGKLGLCSKKCMHIFNKKAFCVTCTKKFWKMSKHHKVCKNCYLDTFFSKMVIDDSIRKL